MPELGAHPPDGHGYPCGVFAAWNVGRYLGGETPPLDALESRIQPTHGPRGTDLLELKRHFEAEGLTVVGVRSSLAALDRRLDRFVAVAHCAGARFPEGHLVVVRKDGRDFELADGWELARYPMLSGHRKALGDLERSWEMTGAFLVVDRRPVEIPESAWDALPAAGMLLAGAVIVAALTRRVFVRRQLPTG